MKYLLIVFVAIFFKISFAQEITTAWGKEGQQVLGLDKTGNIISADNKAINAVLSKYKAKGTTGLKFWKSTNEGIFDNCINTAHHFYFPVLNVKDKKEIIQFLEVDSKGKVKGNIRQVTADDISVRITLVGQEKENFDVEGLYISDDKKTLMKLTACGILAPAKPEKITITVFDEDLNIIWRKVQEFTYFDNVMNISDALVTDDGKVILTADILKPKGNKSEFDKYLHKVFVVTKESVKEGTYFTDNSKAPTSNNLVDSKNGKIIISGLYSNSEQTGNRFDKYMNGSYTVDFDLNSGSISHYATFSFLKSTIDSILGYSSKIKLNGIPDLSTSALLKSNNNNYVLVVDDGRGWDNYTIDAASGTSGPIVSQHGSFDKIAIFFDQDLKRKFETVVHSNFVSSTMNTGISAFMSGDNILLISSLGYSRAKNYECVVTLIDSSGNIILTKQINGIPAGYEFRSELSRQLNSNEFVINFAESSVMGHYSETKFKEVFLSVK